MDERFPDYVKSAMGRNPGNPEPRLVPEDVPAGKSVVLLQDCGAVSAGGSLELFRGWTCPDGLNFKILKYMPYLYYTAASYNPNFAEGGLEAVRKLKFTFQGGIFKNIGMPSISDPKIQEFYLMGIAPVNGNLGNMMLCREVLRTRSPLKIRAHNALTIPVVMGFTLWGWLDSNPEW